MVCVKKAVAAVATVASYTSSPTKSTAAAPTSTGLGSGKGSGIGASNSTIHPSSPSSSPSSSSVGAARVNTTTLAVTTTTKAAANTAANTGIKGFNYGAFFMDYSAKFEADFEYEFARAQDLTGTTGWTSARLYTMVQSGTTSDVIQAIPAAITTQTKLLLGLWVSGSTSAITNEIAALKAAIATYGTAFTDLVQGISVGSEDLYRAAAGEAGEPGVEVDALIGYIAQVRAAIAGTALAAAPVGHVDTYDSYANGTNAALVASVDWVGFDGYPYWESDNANAIEDAAALFFAGLNKTNAVAQGKPVWVTETGWPAVGETFGAAVANAANARTYWEEVTCALVASNVNIWYYDLQESQKGQASPDFGIFPAGDLNTVAERWDLSCPA